MNLSMPLSQKNPCKAALLSLFSCLVAVILTYTALSTVGVSQAQGQLTTASVDMDQDEIRDAINSTGRIYASYASKGTILKKGQIGTMVGTYSMIGYLADGRILCMSNDHVFHGIPGRTKGKMRGPARTETFRNGRILQKKNADLLHWKRVGAMTLDISFFAIPNVPGVTITPLGTPDDLLKVGDEILTVGCDGGETPNAQFNIVTSLDKDHGCFEYAPTCYGGDSGSAVFDKTGKKVIGLVAWSVGWEQRGRAMDIVSILDELKASGLVVYDTPPTLKDMPQKDIARDPAELQQPKTKSKLPQPPARVDPTPAKVTPLDRPRKPILKDRDEPLLKKWFEDRAKRVEDRINLWKKENDNKNKSQDEKLKASDKQLEDLSKSLNKSSSDVLRELAEKDKQLNQLSEQDLLALEDIAANRADVESNSGFLKRLRSNLAAERAERDRQAKLDRDRSIYFDYEQDRELRDLRGKYDGLFGKFRLIFHVLIVLAVFAAIGLFAGPGWFGKAFRVFTRFAGKGVAVVFGLITSAFKNTEKTEAEDGEEQTEGDAS